MGKRNEYQPKHGSKQAHHAMTGLVSVVSQCQAGVSLRAEETEISATLWALWRGMTLLFYSFCTLIRDGVLRTKHQHCNSLQQKKNPQLVVAQGRRLTFTVVYSKINRGSSSGCISMFSINLTFDKTLMMQLCYFFLQRSPLFVLKCVSIQNSS